MKIQVMSDLHVEFAMYSPPEVVSDVVVLAGDIGVGLDALDWVNESFRRTPVVYVLGNHEYYDHDLSLIDEFKRKSRKNIFVLDNEETVIDGVRFLGSTLWTDFALFGEGEQFHAMQHAAQGMPDFEVIREEGGRFTPQSSLAIHQQSRSWLAESLATPFNGSTVVVTHHAPSFMSVAHRFKTDRMTPSFASKLESLIEESGPDLWIHGHTHDSFDYQIFETRVVCNPRGYPEESGRYGFIPSLVVDL